jgi:hypothetical protein
MSTSNDSRDRRLGRIETRCGRIYFMPAKSIAAMGDDIHCGLEDDPSTQYRVAVCYETAASIRKATRKAKARAA